MKADTTQLSAGSNVAKSQLGGYVLPAPPRGSRDQLVTMPLEAAPVPGLSESVAQAIGGRLQLRAESMQMLLEELRARVSRLARGVEEDSRAQLQAAVRGLAEVLGWCDAVQEDLASEAGRARVGQAPLDLAALCEQIAGAAGSDRPITVDVVGPAWVWGHRSRVRQLLDLALEVVWMRAGERGLRSVSVRGDDDELVVRIRSAAEPRGGVASDLVDDFRRAADSCGVHVAPDGLGRGVAGLVLRFDRR